jgi:lysozyme
MTSVERQGLVDQLILHEGLRLKVYEDSVGVPTIGVGRNLAGKGITFGEAMLLLDHDIDEVLADLATFPWFGNLDPVRQRVLADLRFNLGPDRFRIFKRMIAALAAGDYQKASVSMRESKWYRQVKSRAVRLVKQMQTGQDR